MLKSGQERINSLPFDYEERVYAGVLGKIIGVYLGRPFEGWTNEKIERELGEIRYYVHEKRGVSLIVADDDISGTFTFLRALADNGHSPNISAAQIGRTWLNYLIENRTVLWWGGMGHSTEHTAYLRLKSGIDAPESGSIELNGQVVAEQIGSQIFIDGWAMVAPGNPDLAFELAGKAASVSHDGEAVFAAQFLAVMESLAFVRTDILEIINEAQTFLPRASLIYGLVDDLKEWHVENPTDWRATFRKIEDKYGYDKYGGNCHVIPNHAVILLALLYSDNDFGQSLMIANTAGWDTDCNSGNVGCFMGILNGLDGLSTGADYRTPVADKMFLPTADGGRCITDACTEAYRIVNTARTMMGLRPALPDNGMRFHFNLPGVVHGFDCDPAIDASGTAQVKNVAMTRLVENTSVDGRVLSVRYEGVAPGRVARVGTPTFIPPSHKAKGGGYGLSASPTLYSGQTVRARVIAAEQNERVAPVHIFVRVYGDNDEPTILTSPVHLLHRGDAHTIEWTIPEMKGQPICEVGIELTGHAGNGVVYLDWMHWHGAPTLTLCRPSDHANSGGMWLRAWVNAADVFESVRSGNSGSEASGMCYRLIQNRGVGQVIQGTESWEDYVVKTVVNPHLAARVGLLANVSGLRRHVGVVLTKAGKAQLIESSDGVETVLAETDIEWGLDKAYPLLLTSRADGMLVAEVGSETLAGYVDSERARGAVALMVEEGHAFFGPVDVEPAAPFLIG